MTQLSIYINAGPAYGDLKWRIDGFTKNEFIGCESATVSAVAALDEVYKIEPLINTLGMDIHIADDSGEPRWWGYISDVILSRGGTSYGVSLDNMYNAVSVAYADDMGARGTTTWARDNASIGQFREKQIRISASGIEEEAANARRDLALQDMAKPHGQLSFQRANDASPRVTLRCKGYGERLNWRYYTLLNGVHESTLTNGAVQAFGEGSDINRVAQRISPGGVLDYTYLDLPLQKIGAPTDDVIAEIRDGSETGTLISQATFPAASIASSGFKYARALLSVPINSSLLAPWLVVRRTSASDLTNYYKITLDGTHSYSEVPLRLRLGIVWRDGGIPVDGSMNFRFVAPISTTDVIRIAITTLASDIISGIDILAPSDTKSVPYANGDQRLGQEVEKLLTISRYGGMPVFARVTPQKRLAIYSSSSGYPYGIDGVGNLYSPGGSIIPTCTCPVGVYMRPMNVFPSLESTGALSAASSVIVSRAEYQASYNDAGDITDEAYSFIPRGAEDPFDSNLEIG